MKRTTFAFAGLFLAFFAISACSEASSEEEGSRTESSSQPSSEGAQPAAATALLTAPEGATDVMVQEGREIYAGAGICAACHGPDATGAIGPDLTDAEWLVGDGEYEQLVAQILEGVSAEEATNPLGAIMPPKGGAAITEAQVRSVAAYIWALSHSD